MAGVGFGPEWICLVVGETRGGHGVPTGLWGVGRRLNRVVGPGRAGGSKLFSPGSQDLMEFRCFFKKDRNFCLVSMSAFP